MSRHPVIYYNWTHATNTLAGKRVAVASLVWQMCNIITLARTCRCRDYITCKAVVSVIERTNFAGRLVLTEAWEAGIGQIIGAQNQPGTTIF